MILLFSAALAASPGTVELPWPDFERLYRAWSAQQQGVVAPAPFTIDRAELVGTFERAGEGGFVRLRMRLRGAVLARQGWTQIPLLTAGVALQSARVDGKDATLYLHDGAFKLLRDKAGPFTVELDVVAPIKEQDGVTSVTFPLPAASAAALSLSVESPEPLHFDASGAVGVAVTDVGDTRRAELFLPPRPSATVSWRRAAADEATVTEQRVYAEVRTLAGVDEGALVCDTEVEYTVLQAPVSHFQLSLPPEVVVLSVTAPGLSRWAASASGQLDLWSDHPVSGAWTTQIRYERANVRGDLPLPTLLGVTRETAYIGVDTRSAVELVPGEARGATAIDVRELPPAITGRTDYPVLLAYRARGGDVHIPLDARSHDDLDGVLTLVDTASAETVITPEGRRITRVRWALRNNRRQHLRVTMPEGAEVWSAVVAGRAIRVGSDSGDVLVPLVRSDAAGGALSAFEVELVYLEPGAPLGARGDVRVALPKIDAPTTLLQWTLRTPANIRIRPRTVEGTARPVETWSAPPVLPAEAVVTREAQAAVVAEVANQGETGTLGLAPAPVRVLVPQIGAPSLYERLLVVDEDVWVGFAYVGSRP